MNKKFKQLKIYVYQEKKKLKYEICFYFYKTNQ